MASEATVALAPQTSTDIHRNQESQVGAHEPIKIQVQTLSCIKPAIKTGACKRPCTIGTQLQAVCLQAKEPLAAVWATWASSCFPRSCTRMAPYCQPGRAPDMCRSACGTQKFNYGSLQHGVQSSLPKAGSLSSACAGASFTYVVMPRQPNPPVLTSGALGSGFRV